MAFAIGIAVGWFDFRMQTDDNLPAVVMIGAPCFVLGLLWPNHSWRWGLLLGLGVPLWHFAGSAFGYHAAYSVHPNSSATFLALIPALVASLVGAGIRRWTGVRPAA